MIPWSPVGEKDRHKRPTRDYCLAVLESYSSLDFQSFTGLIRSFFGTAEDAQSESESPEPSVDGASAFAQRLITGLAAEQYFESVHSGLPEFKGYVAENATRYGCGYDFRLTIEPDRENFLAVEVKGLRGQTGSVSMTPKEYDAAGRSGERLILFW